MARRAKQPAPDRLKMDLFAPGMTAMHRAGLGGLACTLEAARRRLGADALPFSRTSRSLELLFGSPTNAGDYLRRLFEFAFRIRDDGLISLPGQFEREPPAAVLADLQAGLLLTFLQHGKVRQLAKETSTAQYDPQGDGTPGLIIEYRRCFGFKHQDGWHTLVDKSGALVRGTIKVDGPISPGATVRHVAFTAQTAAEDTADRMLPLYFALVGCLALPVNRGVAVLLVPEVTDLDEFILDRPAMTPTTASECQIAGAADAALQAEVRLRGRQRLRGSMVQGFRAMTFTGTPWASQQKSRVATQHVDRCDDHWLDRFERALTHLPSRIVKRVIREATGRGKSKRTEERQVVFRVDSVVRPLIAENIASGRPWYAGFTQLMVKNNPATDRPFRDQLSYERKGLHAMINDAQTWDEEGEKLFVQAVHQAMRQSFARIVEDTEGRRVDTPSQATKNRWERFSEKLRLDLAGAKTAAQVRFALADLFSRGGGNPILKGHWQQILPVLRRDWELARDLGLLALASYAGKGEPSPANDSDSTNA